MAAWLISHWIVPWKQLNFMACDKSQQCFKNCMCLLLPAKKSASGGQRGKCSLKEFLPIGSLHTFPASTGESLQQAFAPHRLSTGAAALALPRELVDVQNRAPPHDCDWWACYSVRSTALEHSTNNESPALAKSCLAMASSFIGKVLSLRTFLPSWNWLLGEKNSNSFFSN